MEINEVQKLHNDSTNDKSYLFDDLELDTPNDFGYVLDGEQGRYLIPMTKAKYNSFVRYNETKPKATAEKVSGYLSINVNPSVHTYENEQPLTTPTDSERYH